MSTNSTPRNHKRSSGANSNASSSRASSQGREHCTTVVSPSPYSIENAFIFIPVGEELSDGRAFHTDLFGHPVSAGPIVKGVDLAAQNGEEQQTSGMSSIDIWSMIAIDAAMWVALLWRNYRAADGFGFNRPIAHYCLVLTVTDVTALLYVPRSRLHWYNVFRIFGAVQLAVLTMQLRLYEIDGPNPAVSFVRYGMCVLRALHGLKLLFQYGPHTLRDAFALLAVYCPSVTGPIGLEPLIAVILVLAGNYLESTHYNFGQPLVDAPLSGFQASNAITAFVKLYVAEKLVVNMYGRFWMHAILCVSLLLQWPLMFDMFLKAPRPLVHAMAEVGVIIGVGVRYWWHRKRRV